jgi:hypothetical protein
LLFAGIFDVWGVTFILGPSAHHIEFQTGTSRRLPEFLVVS